MFNNSRKTLGVFLLAYSMSAPVIAYGQDDSVSGEPEKVISDETWNAKFQATFIGQRKPSFNARYSGTNSLIPQGETGYSGTVTAFFGFRPWHGTELYFNPEAVQAVAFSGLHGLGGLTDSEQQKTTSGVLSYYRARLFLRQTFGFGGGQEAVESGQNQLAGMVDRRRLVITAGNLAVIDIFDNNAYAHDPRTQFLNWAFLTQGAYDFVADARGYSEGIAAEYYRDDWVLRFGRFLGPEQSNGLPLDHRFFKHYGDQVEGQYSYTLSRQPGKVRLLAFRNKEFQGKFGDALGFAALNGGIPDVAQVRRENAKYGFGVNIEQSLRTDVGMFGRASWADGQTETFSYTEVERSISAGIVVNGRRWARPRDTFGIALAANGLSKVHQEYLALGGLGAFIGDGRLTYKPERIVETYYNISLGKSTWLAFDLQHIENPAYNADRGPVNVGSFRLHTEF